MINKLPKLRHINPGQMKQILKNKPSSDKCMGAYKEPTKKFRNGRIYLNNKYKDYRIIGVWLHEFGHHKCFQKKCVCIYSSNHALSEAHAIMYSIKKAYKRKLTNVFNWLMSNTIFYSEKENEKDKIYSVYYKAAEIFMSSPTWKFYKKIYDKNNPEN